jgi:hypothetical protein
LIKKDHLNQLRITKTLYNPDNNMIKYELTPPKTKGSIRTIDIDEERNETNKGSHKKTSQVQNGPSTRDR